MLKNVVAARDLKTAYANNVRFEQSVWDLKMTFGQLAQNTGKADIDWHTAVTMPWMATKILEYYLRLNIAYYEKVYGPLQVQPRVIPPLQDPPTKEQLAADPKTIGLYETYKKIHEEIFGS